MTRTARAVATLALAGLVWLVYANSLRNPFEFDDWHVVPQNPEVRSPSDIPEFFTDVSKFSILPGNRDYRPMFLSSMALSWWIGGGSTWPFHVGSILLHMANVLLVFFVLRRVFGSADESIGGLSPPLSDWTALVGAVLFAVHPLATEAIDYISSQSVPMTAFFYLTAFALFLSLYTDPARGSKTGRIGKRSLSYLAYLAALLSKPIAVTLPLNLVLWDLLLGPPEEQDSSRPKRIARRALKHIPFVLVTLGYMAIRSQVTGRAATSPGGVGKPLDVVILHKLTQTKAMITYYLKLALFPVGQNVDVEFPRSTSLLDPGWLVSLAVIVAVAWLLIRFRRQRVLVFWVLWFPSCLLVTTYLVVLGQTVREARVYLSLVGVCAVAAWCLAKLWRALPLSLSDSILGLRSGRRLLVVVTVIVTVLFAAGTVHRNRIWATGLSLWGDAAKGRGTWRAHMNYGLALENEGRGDEALSEFKRAVDLGSYSWAHLNLGLAYIRRADNDLGLRHLETAVRLWPTSPEGHYYHGIGLGRAGRDAEAEAAMLRAIELRPNYLLAYQGLGQMYEEQERYDLALASYQRVIEIDPGNAWATTRILKLQQGDTSRSLEALFNKAFAAQKNGDREQAIALYEELLRRNPDHRNGNFNLGYAYLRGSTEEDWQRAVSYFQKVLEIDPGYREAVHRLASAHWKLGDRDAAIEFDTKYLEGQTHPDLEKVSRRRLAEAGVEL